MIQKVPWGASLAVLGGVSVALFSGWSIMTLPLGSSHPIILGLGGIALLPVLFRPIWGVLLLLLTLWLSPFFPGAGLVSLNRIVGVLVLIGMIARKSVRSDDRPFRVDRSDYYAWGFAGAALLSATINWPLAPGFFVRLWTLLMGYLIYFLLVNAVKSWKELEAVAWWLVGCSLVVAVSTLNEALTTAVTGGVWRAEGIRENPNQAAVLSFFGLVLLSWLTGRCSARKSRAHYLLYSLVPVFVLAILATGSRAIFIALLVMVVVRLLLLPKIAPRIKYALVAILGFIGIFYVGSTLSPILMQRFWTLLPAYDRIAGASAEQVESLELDADARFGLMRAGWNMFTTRPVLGIGFGNFKPQNSLYGSGRSGQGTMGHNLLFTTLGETGLIGGILLFLLYRESFARLWRARRRLAPYEGTNAVNAIGILTIGVNVIYAMMHVDTVDRSMFVAFALGAIATRLLLSDDTSTNALNGKGISDLESGA